MIFLKGKILNGELVISNKELIRHFLLSKEGTDVEIEIKKLNKSISSGQMRWYRGVAIPIIVQRLKELTGEIWTNDEIHAYNISKIVRPKITTRVVLGETVVETKKFSLSNMNREQFSAFKNKLQFFWAQKDIDIPDPNEDNYLNDEHTIDNFRGFKKRQ